MTVNKCISASSQHKQYLVRSRNKWRVYLWVYILSNITRT